MKKRLTLIILGTVLTSYIFLIVFSAINIRNIGIKGAEEKAIIAAELVKDGLTAHMVSGVMDNREYFLTKIENSQNIKSLWVTRSPSVIEQFGAGFNNEIPRDDIDREVIQKGHIFKKVIEDSHSADLRVTVPYIASQRENPNCMSCHNAKEGDVLGTVSIIVDINDVRVNGMTNSAFISIISIVMLLIVFFILHKSMSPVIKLFESITYVMGKAGSGDYSKRVQDVSDTKDYANVVFWINSLLDKLQDTLEEIQNTVKIFLTKGDENSSDMLLELKSLVLEIADLHNFKKTIEFDETKPEIYGRIGTLLKEKFKLDDFVLVENDTRKNTTPKVVYTTFKDTNKEINTRCRALRTKQVVNSQQFKEICTLCNKKTKYYYCLPFTISSELEIMLHIETDSKEIIETMKKSVDRFEDYINEARAEIVSKNLTEILRHSSTTDALTGLFNRKYLDEYIEKALAQAQRAKATFGILMIDIDFFKMVNDTYGHDIGDKVIKKLATVLKESIRSADIAFRFGGEEFLVLLYNCDRNKIDDIAQKIRLNFEKTKIEAGDGTVFSKTLSIGTSFHPNDASSIWKAIKYADISLYKAKNSGRNRVVNFEKSFLKETGLPDDY